jgi:hydrogenase maturation protease
MRTRVLIAGVGNIFFRDDGFGPAVAAAMLSSPTPLPNGVRVVDYGIRGMHLMYDLLDGVDALVLVDAVPGDAENAPGDLIVLTVGSRQDDLGRPEFGASAGGDRSESAPPALGSSGDPIAAPIDAHSTQPVSMLAGLTAMGGELPRTFVVGCVPADVSAGMGLSEPVTAAIGDAVAIVQGLARQLADGFVGAMPGPDQEAGG